MMMGMGLRLLDSRWWGSEVGTGGSNGWIVGGLGMLMEDVGGSNIPGL